MFLELLTRVIDTLSGNPLVSLEVTSVRSGTSDAQFARFERVIFSAFCLILVLRLLCQENQPYRLPVDVKAVYKMLDGICLRWALATSSASPQSPASSPSPLGIISIHSFDRLCRLLVTKRTLLSGPPSNA